MDEEETKQLVSALITNQPEKTCGRVVERSTEFLAQPSSAVPVSYDLNKVRVQMVLEEKFIISKMKFLFRQRQAQTPLQIKAM